MRSRLFRWILMLMLAVAGCGGDTGSSPDDGLDADDADTLVGSDGDDDVDTTDGAGDVADGAGDVTDGAGDVTDGAGDVTDGAGDVTDGAGDVTDGASDTTDGATGDTADGGDVDACTGGSLCGSPPVCCPSGNECIDSVCLAVCDSGVRCGPEATCCAAGSVCVADACATPGGACGDSYDCEPGEFCEPTLGQCLPQSEPVTCTVTPSVGAITPIEEWSWTDENIISIPVVGNIQGDAAPEVVLNLSRIGGADWPVGSIAALDGRTGAELWRIDHDPANGRYGSHGRSTIALGDVSADGRDTPDILYASREVSGASYLVAVDGDGALLWRARRADGAVWTGDVENGAVTVANFDDDPQAEVVLGASLFDHDGLNVWNEGDQGPRYGSNSGYLGGISAVADLDGDGAPEIVSGRDAWKVSWTPGPPPTVTVTPYWSALGTPDGYPAVADFDGDGAPEVVLVGSRTVRVLNGQTGELWCGADPSGAACVADASARTQPIFIPGQETANRGGPPTIADFDGDGRPEIGVAGGWSYSVYDLNRPGEVVDGGQTPGAGALFVRWSQATDDDSSNATGSAVFDFQGDGAAEVVYADECYMRVYSGVTGEVELEVMNSSATIHEYPLVVDVDADGNSEILIVANDVVTCPAPASGDPYVKRRGLFVYGDLDDAWVPTRKVWTQHAYHVTNATSSGNVPLAEDANWEVAGLNNARQNVQGAGVFNAPDLSVGLSVGVDLCPAQHELRARVTNQGSLGVGAGVPVSFYRGSSAAGELLGTIPTEVALLPGASTTVILAADLVSVGDTVTYHVVVNGDVDASGVVECDASNNTTDQDGVQCIVF